jgi:signal transduction histidine kinase
MRSTLFRKGLWIAALPLFFQIVFVALTGYLMRQYARINAQNIQTQEIVQTAEQVLHLLVNAETGARGYTLTDNAAFTEPFWNSDRDLPSTMAQLRGLVDDSTEDRLAVAEIQRHADIVMERHRSMIELVKSGHQEEATTHITTGEGKRRMDAARGVINVLTSRMKRQDAARRERLATFQNYLLWSLVTGGLLAFALSGAIAWAISRKIVRRLQILADNTVRLKEQRPLNASVGGHDEITQVDGAFHAMAAELARIAGINQRHAEELEQRVNERTGELALTNRELKQKNEENDLFVFSVSHDLRAPLVNLQGFSEELRMSCEELRAVQADATLPETLRVRVTRSLDDVTTSLRFIQSGVCRLSLIIDALLRLSRAGRVEYNWQNVNVHETVDRIVDSLQQTIAQRDATVLIDALPNVWGDPVAVEQIFGNLLANALNYLDVKRPGVIRVSGAVAEDNPEQVVYRVEDNGVGIPAGQQGKVFQAFQRLHPTLAVGEGMGLPLVRRIVSRHGGSIDLESVEGQCTTFFVRLPIATSQDASFTPESNRSLSYVS